MPIAMRLMAQGSERWKNRLKLFPLVPADPGLAENARKKVTPNVALVRIRQRDGRVAAHHVLVLAAGIWPTKASLLEVADKIPAFHRAECRHYTASLKVSDNPSTIGSGRLRETRKRIQPSRTSSSSSRQASSVAAFA